MKKNTASPSRLNQVAKAYMDHHNEMKKAAKSAEGSPAEEAAESPLEAQAESDSGLDAASSHPRKLDKLRKPKVPRA